MLSINTNLNSLITQRHLNYHTDALATAMERLTTGFKINHAKDDAAGCSISNKMQTEISSYQTALTNIAMGTDLIDTAMGSMDIITEHLQRIRELCEQGANGTYGEQSRDAIQTEIDQRVEEIKRIQATTEYNGKTLLTGTKGATSIEGFDYDNYTPVEYLESTGTQYIDTGIMYSNSLALEGSFKYVTMNFNEAVLGIDTSGNVGGSMNIVIKENNRIRMTCNWITQLYIPADTNWHTFKLNKKQNIMQIDTTSATPGIVSTPRNIWLFATNSNVETSIGYGKVQISDYKVSSDDTLIQNFIPCKRKSDDEAGMYDTVTKQFFENKGTGEFVAGAELPQPEKSTEITIQAGIDADESSQITFVTSFDLGEMSFDVSTDETSRACLDKVDDLLTIVSGKQTELGATQNRLNSAMKSTEVSIENLTSSLSTIRDTDVAETSSEYVKHQILQQACATLLATANQSPSIALQLIRTSQLAGFL